MMTMLGAATTETLKCKARRAAGHLLRRYIVIPRIDDGYVALYDMDGMIFFSSASSVLRQNSVESGNSQVLLMPPISTQDTFEDCCISRRRLCELVA